MTHNKIILMTFVSLTLLMSQVFAQDDQANMATLSTTDASSVNSQNAQISAVPLPEPGIELTEPALSASNAPQEASSLKKGNVTLDFREADIRNVLRILSYKSGVNIVAGPEVTGVVTIQLTDVPWEEALKVILETYGYGYDKKGNIIVVTTIENLKKRREDALVLADQEPVMTRTFVLNYAKASEIVDAVAKMKTARGSVNFDARTNTLIVRDTESNLALISEVMPAFDATTPQVLIEAKMIETTLSNADKLGINWTAKITASLPKRPLSFPYKNDDLGDVYMPGSFGAPASSLFTFGTIDASAFSAVLEFLQSKSDTNILSNPRIVTLDNQKAVINVGTQYPIPTYTYNEEQAKLQISGWTYMDIGVIFEVTPHVNNAGYVTLDLKPKVTAILDFVTVENTSLPRLSNESASTRVMVKDGYTLVIAGLVKDQVTETKKKLPLLGDIPIAGLLFQKNEKTVDKTDLLIFMTPHVIMPEAPAVLQKSS